ncbi:MAG: hypothetical protein M3P53_00785 [Actinomycetota bacterium]|nr:hypothetical protein [Actinomycetota bacterium]
MVFAETPQIFDAGTIFIGLLLLVAVFAATCAVVVGGRGLAFRAGRGSRRALRKWLVLAVVGLLLALAMVPDVLEGRLLQPFAFVSAVLKSPTWRCMQGPGPPRPADRTGDRKG